MLEITDHSNEAQADTQITTALSMLTILVVGLIIAPILSRTQERRFIAFEFFASIQPANFPIFIEKAMLCRNLNKDIQDQNDM